MDRYTKFRDDRPIRSRVILGKPEGVASTSPVPARVNMLGCIDNQKVTFAGSRLYVGRHRVRPLTTLFSRFAAKAVRRVGNFGCGSRKKSMGLGGDRRVRVHKMFISWCTTKSHRGPYRVVQYTYRHPPTHTLHVVSRRTTTFLHIFPAHTAGIQRPSAYRATRRHLTHINS